MNVNAIAAWMSLAGVATRVKWRPGAASPNG
jgi:hypothetical protein